MTFAEMIRRVLAALDNSSEEGSQRYTATAIAEYLQDGATLYQVRVGTYRTTATITQIPGQALYALPDACVAVDRMSWESAGVKYPVSPTTIRELDELFVSANGWEDDTGTRAEWYYIFGLNQIGLYPQVRSGTQTYTVHYRGYSAAYPVSGAATGYVADEDHPALVSYAVARCLAVDQKVEEASERYAMFAQTVEAARSRRSSPDRRTDMSSGAGWQSIERVLP